MTTHRLKTFGWAYDATKDGRKPFEIRINDRGFQSGDIVILERLRDDNQTVDTSAPLLIFNISFVTHFQQKEGYCVFGLIENKTGGV